MSKQLKAATGNYSIVEISVESVTVSLIVTKCKFLLTAAKKYAIIKV